jgi:hypothetical protein
MNRLNDLRNLGLWIIKSMRTSLPIYVLVSKNFIKVKNLKNGKTASGKSQDNFSTDRILLADPITAENFTKELIKQVAQPNEIKTRKLKVICHPLDELIADLSPSEKMTFNDFAYRIGGRYVYLLDGKQELTDSELKEKNYA